MADLSEAQLVALRDDITITNADQLWQGDTLSNWYGRKQWQIVADWYQETKDPENLVWRPDLLPEEMVCVLDTEELEALAAPTEATHRTWTIKLMLWSIITRVPQVDATDSQTQANFSSMFGPPQPDPPGPIAPLTYANLIAIARRPATNGEDLYTGSPWTSGTSISAIYGQKITAENVRETQKV